MVPTWTLLAALTAGLILGVLGTRLFQRPSPAPAPAEPSPSEEPAPQPPAVEAQEPQRAPPAPPEPAPEPAPEHVRISMEDVVSELERRYQGRQADANPSSTQRKKKDRAQREG